MKQFIVLTSLVFSFLWARAQNSIDYTLNAHSDVYISQFDHEGEGHQALTTVGSIPGFFRNNMSLLGLGLEHKYFRAQFTGHHGSIVEATWDGKLAGIQEAYIGLHIFPNFYVDAGYFKTHVGMESFMPKDNLLSSTSIITYNEPFYQRGVRAVYEGIENLDLQLWLLDGYNLFRDDNDQKSIGLLAAYSLGKLNFSYSNIVGLEPVGTENALRAYHNFYVTYDFLNDIFELQSSVDFATQNGTSSVDPKQMVTFIATLRANVTPHISITARYENQSDPDGMLTAGISPLHPDEGIRMSGYTIGTAYEISDLGYIRYEIRYLTDADKEKQIFGDSSFRTENLFTVGLMLEKSGTVKFKKPK